MITAALSGRGCQRGLLAGMATESQIPDDAREDLVSVVFCGGRNGWIVTAEKARAKQHFSRHVSRTTHPDQATAYALSSQSLPNREAKQLRDLLRHSPGSAH